MNLLTDIQKLQATVSDSTYPKGIFPSSRSYNALGLEREDDNSFFTALIVFTLERLRNHFSPEELAVVNEIRQNAIKAFPRYKNKKGEGTYNFWRTEPNAHFPNGTVLSKFNSLHLPDDLDCTALVNLAKGCTEEDITNFRKTLSNYQNSPLYPTWFGENTIYIFDLCATSNMLYFIFKNKASLNQQDEENIRYLCSIIDKNEHKIHPFRVAPYYPKTSIILYHITRLLTIVRHPELLQLKNKLAEDVRNELNMKLHPMENIFLNTCLMWLGENNYVKELEMPVDTHFPWFIAGALTSFDNPVAKLLAPYPLFHINFYCEAYMKTLYLEYSKTFCSLNSLKPSLM